MKVTHAKALSGHRLELEYETGETGTVDLSALVGRGVFSVWNDVNVYKAVRVTAEGAVEWPGELDLCPDALYLQMTGKSPLDVFPSLDERPAHA
ncbi:MAG TPA: DUF2442 domain-containing protein [Lacipirellulaceae bacterium]|jgi:hypothetical protein|nr:DUF2442 domain-containing protein [Lacipirellulaceae bacterium]